MKQFITIIICSLLTFSANAKEVKGVKFPEELKVGTTTLKLNGVGIRTAMSILSVYVGGLYVAVPSTDPKVIVDAATPKRIDMHFLMAVGMDKLKEAWNEGFFKNAEKGYEYREDLNKFFGLLRGMKSKDRIQLTFLSDKLEVQINEEPIKTVEGANFTKTMLKLYIMNLSDTGLKNGLLGLKKN
jgi:hypothetical protein